MSGFGSCCIYCKGPADDRRNGLYLCASCDDRFTEGDPRLPPAERERVAIRKQHEETK